MTDIDDTCEYVLDPDDPETWDGEEEDECHIGEGILNDKGLWKCPHNAEKEKDLCIFHLPVEEKDDERVVETFIEILETTAKNESFSEEKRKLQFIGGKFGEFELDNEDMIQISENPYIFNIRHLQKNSIYLAPLSVMV